MNEPTGQQGWAGRHGLPCPECGALRAADNTPSCACAQRASEALRDTREAEAAAAGDFDPLRIRPYVDLGDLGDLGGRGDGTGESGESGEAGEGRAGAAEVSAADATTRLPAVSDDTMPVPTISDATRPAPTASDVTKPVPTAYDATRPVPMAADASRPVPMASDATMPLRAVEPDGPDPRAAALPTPLAAAPSEPSAADLSLFGAGRADGSGAYADDERPHGRRRRTLLIASAGAAVAVIAAAGFASGLFTYEAPTRDGAAPEGVRAAVPDPSTSAASVSPSASRSASPSASSSASPSPSESAGPTPSPSASSASPSASPTAEPSPSEPTARVTGSLVPGNGADEAENSPEATVLRRGDRGAEVTELQSRLRQLYLYNDEADGVFDSDVEQSLRNYQWSRGIQDDELGVYGAATRQKLESETKEP
ncbi:peptidoglycan-binding protein [Streptomyces sp. NPDC014995]|uniref:peptidoglycan-binding domain-containing protein n=1 Tax=Streptomyces sp. NPDC014995 TaxID=3364936 RepID=UPI0037024DB6